MNIRLVSPFVTIIAADTVGLAVGWWRLPYALRPLYDLAWSRPFSVFVFLFLFISTCTLSDTLHACLQKRFPARSPERAFRPGYRDSARDTARPGPSSWVFRESWPRTLLLKRAVPSLILTVLICRIAVFLVYYDFVLVVPTCAVYFVAMAFWIVSAHVQYLSSFVILTVNGPELRLTRLGARDQGRAGRSTIETIRAIDGLILVPYQDSLWLNKPLAETKRGRYVLLRPTYPDSARSIVDQIRHAAEPAR